MDNTRINITPTIVRADGSKRELPTRQNMLTDYAITYLRDKISCIEYGLGYFKLGDSNEQNYRDGVANTISCSISTVTSSVPFFTVADVGRVIQFSDNTKYRIQSFISDTSVTIDGQKEITAATVRIWETDIVKLKNYVRQSDTTYGGWGEGFGTTYEYHNGGVDNTFMVKKSFRVRRFDYVTAGAVIREIGWSNSISTTNYLWGRLVLPDPIVMNTAEMLLLKIEIEEWLPAGEISADPWFGLPARIVRDFGSYYCKNSGFITDTNGSSHGDPCPAFLPCDDYYVNMLYDGGYHARYDKTPATMLSKPYINRWDKLSFLGSVADPIIGFGLGSSGTNQTTWYYTDLNNLPQLRSDQLIEVTPECRYDQRLPPYPGFSETVPNASGISDVTAFNSDTKMTSVIPSLNGQYISDAGITMRCLTLDSRDQTKLVCIGNDIKPYQCDLDGTNMVKLHDTALHVAQLYSAPIYVAGTWYVVYNNLLRKYDSSWNYLSYKTLPDSVYGITYNYVDGCIYFVGYSSLTSEYTQRNFYKYDPATDVISTAGTWTGTRIKQYRSVVLTSNPNIILVGGSVGDKWGIVDLSQNKMVDENFVDSRYGNNFSGFMMEDLGAVRVVDESGYYKDLYFTLPNVVAV